MVVVVVVVFVVVVVLLDVIVFDVGVVVELAVVVSVVIAHIYGAVSPCRVVLIRCISVRFDRYGIMSSRVGRRGTRLG